MSLRNRIIIQLLTILAAVVLMTLAVVGMVNAASDALEDVQVAHRQYRW